MLLWVMKTIRGEVQARRAEGTGLDALWQCLAHAKAMDLLKRTLQDRERRCNVVTVSG